MEASRDQLIKELVYADLNNEDLAYCWGAFLALDGESVHRFLDAEVGSEYYYRSWGDCNVPAYPAQSLFKVQRNAEKVRRALVPLQPWLRDMFQNHGGIVANLDAIRWELGKTSFRLNYWWALLDRMAVRKTSAKVWSVLWQERRGEWV